MNRGLVALIAVQIAVTLVLLVALVAQIAIGIFQHTYRHPACYEVSDARCWAETTPTPQETK